MSSRQEGRRVDGRAVPPPVAGQAARDLLFQILAELLAELAEAPAPVAADADLERDLGLGSLERAELRGRVERAFAVQLPESALAVPQTPASLLRLVEEAAGGVGGGGVGGGGAGGGGGAAKVPAAQVAAAVARAAPVAQAAWGGRGAPEGRAASVAPAPLGAARGVRAERGAREAREALRYGGHALFAAWATAAWIAVVVPTMVLVEIARCGPDTCWAVVRRGLRLWGRLSGLLPRVEGRELPPGRFILVSNHGSNLDPLLLMMAFARPLTFCSKREVFDWPLIGRVMRRMRHLSIDRDSAPKRLHSYLDIAGAVGAGRLVHMFPEGTFGPAAGIGPLRMGAFQLAAEAGVTVVPVALRGNRRALGDGQWLVRPARIEAEVLAPVAPPATAGCREVARLRDQVRRALAAAVREPLLDGAGTTRDERLGRT